MEIRVRNNFGQIGDFSPTPKAEQVINDLKNIQATEETITAIQLTLVELFEQAVASETNTQMAIVEIYETLLA